VSNAFHIYVFNHIKLEEIKILFFKKQGNSFVRNTQYAILKYIMSLFRNEQELEACTCTYI
jgi:hypothetical protein